MGKVILIIDNPDECRNCPCFNGFYFGGYCGKEDKEIKYDYDKCEYTKPDWCPLKPIPEKKEVHPYSRHCMNQCCAEGEKGWNECLDAILGEK